jgi:hypothetical protein
MKSRATIKPTYAAGNLRESCPASCVLEIHAPVRAGGKNVATVNTTPLSIVARPAQGDCPAILCAPSSLVTIFIDVIRNSCLVFRNKLRSHTQAIKAVPMQPFRESDTVPGTVHACSKRLRRRLLHLVLANLSLPAMSTEWGDNNVPMHSAKCTLSSSGDDHVVSAALQS